MRWTAGDVLGSEVGSGVEGVDSLLSEKVLEDGMVGWVKVKLFWFLVISSKTTLSIYMF